jgi:lysophospholipase L1-like esterase
MTLPAWGIFSLATNAILSITVSLLLLRNATWQGGSRVQAEAAFGGANSTERTAMPGEKRQLTYEEWLDVLSKEAKAVIDNPPKRLTVLTGDSLSLWFPAELLPTETTWLNQGISGESSDGLYKRLKLLDNTNPEAIFIMIGINDLLQNADSQALIDNYWKIVRDLHEHHPNAQIIVQSILPHGGDTATWEGRDRLKEISNDRISELNDELEKLAETEGVNYLDLQALFSDETGKIRRELTTDGLHLNEQGYLVWRSALQVYTQLELD